MLPAGAKYEPTAGANLEVPSTLENVPLRENSKSSLTVYL